MKLQLPQQFIEMMESYGTDYSVPLLAALATPPAVSVRANGLKGCVPPAGADLVPWCPQGFYLGERPLFAADPQWHQGLYYVQEASSMIYTETVRRIMELFFDGAPLRYLDACAAPGGKTISALEALGKDSFVVANELDRHRANILYENIAKYGAANVAVSRGDAARFGKLREAFDIIAVDAPCSGEGMMRKEPEAVAQWSPSLIAQCAATQRDIAGALWRALKPGGVLIYSTCTFNTLENERNVEWIADTLGAEGIDLGLDSYAGIRRGFSSTLPCYRLTPGHIRGEGIFIAALRKARQWSPSPARVKAAKAPLPFIRQHIKDCSDFVEADFNGRTELRPIRHAAFIADLTRVADLMRGGLPAAAVKGRDTVPVHELALAEALIPGSFPALEMDYAAATAFLHGESLTDIPDSLPRGFFTPTYGGVPLGFAKNIGRRANNLIPDALRLRIDVRDTAAPAPTVFNKDITTQL